MIRILRFLRLIDEKEDLSISNILLMLTIGKLMIQPELDQWLLIVFTFGLVSYAHKRHVTALTRMHSEEALAFANEQIAELVKSTKEDHKLLQDDLKVSLTTQSDMITKHDDIIEKLKVSANFKKLGQ